MNINLDETMIQDSLNGAATKAIENAMGQYSVRHVIEERVASAVLEGVLAEALENSINQIDLGALTTALSKELARAVTAGAVSIIRESVVEILLSLRKIPSYDHEKTARARAEILRQLSGRDAEAAP